MKTHILKTWPNFYGPVADGSKPFEIRFNDREYAVGDTLHLREYDPDNKVFTGRECFRRVTYVTSFGQKPGNVVMGLTAPPPKGGGFPIR